ncbi:MAG: hypothetical protein E7C86_03335 [Paeniclostridium sordellii]|nr:hypothetical protein [Paeniclostridium sordellii]
MIAYFATGTVIFLVLGLIKLTPVNTVAEAAVAVITGCCLA